MAKKTFIHYDKDFAKSNPGLLSAAATAEVACATPNLPTCPTYVFNGTHWNAGTKVTYYVNTTLSVKGKKGSSQLRSGATEAIDASFQAWQTVMPPSGGITFVNGGTTRLAPGKADGRNVVGWSALSSGWLAVTTIWYWPSTGQIVETDMAFNSIYTWAYTPPSGCSLADVSCNPAAAGPAGSYDLRNIGTHEAGHTMMLGDLYDSSNNALTMYGYGSVNERAKDSLGTGDKLGVDAAY